MKNLNLLMGLAFCSFAGIHANAQNCQKIYTEANQLFNEAKLEKAKAKYQQVINCGDPFFVPDSKKKINWIERVTYKPDKAKPFAISDNEIVIPYQGGQDVISIDGDGSWTASVSNTGKDWCRIKKEKGKVCILCDANESNKERSCDINITMAGKTRKVVVRNESAPEMLIPAVENVTFPATGETDTIEIRANTQWNVTDTPEWVVTTKGDGVIMLVAKANENNKERKADIKIESQSKTVIINIFQGAGLDHLAFSKNNLHFGPEGGDEYITVYTDADDWRLGDFPHWCQVSKVAQNLLKVHCTPNEPVNVAREASVNVTTGKQVMGVNVCQDPMPLVAMIPEIGIGGRGMSIGVSAGMAMPFIAASAGGDFTGSVVNYALSNHQEEASYKSMAGLTFGAFADMRVYKNFFLKAGLDLVFYKFKNEFKEDVVRNIVMTSNYYISGNTQNNYTEDYAFTQLDIPVLASYRFATGKICHVQLNAGPVLSYGISAKMNLSGNTDAKEMRTFKYVNHQFTNQRYDMTTSTMSYAGKGELNLYDDDVSYSETYTIGNNQDIMKSQKLDDAPLKRINWGARVGVAVEYAAINLSIEYNIMLSNIANKKYWSGDRWKLFDQTAGVVMSGYKQHNHYLAFKLGYTFRY